MKIRRNSLSKAMTSALTLAGLAMASQGQAQHQVARGSEINPIAGSCNIGPFPQTAKAGTYNQLCHVMQDAEKCFALIKGRFHEDGTIDPIRPWEGITAQKLEYCFDVLKRDLLAE